MLAENPNEAGECVHAAVHPGLAMQQAHLAILPGYGGSKMQFLNNWGKLNTTVALTGSATTLKKGVEGGVAMTLQRLRTMELKPLTEAAVIEMYKNDLVLQML